jgi:hypothetical protein
VFDEIEASGGLALQPLQSLERVEAGSTILGGIAIADVKLFGGLAVASNAREHAKWQSYCSWRS